MLMSRLFSRASRSVGQLASILLPLSSPSGKKQLTTIFSGQYDPFPLKHPDRFVPRQVSLFNHSAISLSPFGRFGFTSSASPEPSEKEQGKGSTSQNNETSSNVEPTKANGGAKPSDEMEDSAPTKDTDFEAGDDLSIDDLVKLVAEKDELVKSKHKEIEQMQDKVLRAYAEMENVMDRTKREAENSKKFAIQNFAKSLLDVADNLGRASSVVKDSFSKIDASNDSAGVVPLLKTLLEGVDMTEKQLVVVFKRFGVEKFDPTNEPFDPHRHNAAFQVPDPSKEPGTVAHVLKPGYMLYDRVIRPAEVGVTQAVDKDAEAKD